MFEKKRTVADAAALIALVVVALAVNLSLVAFTDVPALLRWGITVVAGIVAAATAYVIVSRRARPRGSDPAP